jgi:hypothetical protein
LKWVCESVILDGVSVENVVTLLIASETYKCTRLYRTCLDFIGRHHQYPNEDTVSFIILDIH